MRFLKTSLATSAIAACAAAALASQPSAAAPEAPSTWQLFSAASTIQTTDISKVAADMTRSAELFGADLSQAKSVAADKFRDVYAVPGSDNVCLVTHFKSGGNTFGCSDKGEPTVDVSVLGSTGIVPDGVRTVAIELDNGAKTTIPVVANVFAPPANAAKATYVDHGRTWEIELMPLSSLEKGSTVSADGTTINLGSGSDK